MKLLVFDMGNVFVDFDWDTVSEGFCAVAGLTQPKFAQLLDHNLRFAYEKGTLAPVTL